MSLSADDPSKAHNSRLYVIQKVKKSDEADAAAAGTTPEEAYQAEPREQSSLNQGPAAKPKIPELPDLAQPSPSSRLPNLGEMGGARDPRSMPRQQRELHPPAMQKSAIVIRQEQSAPGLQNDAQ